METAGIEPASEKRTTLGTTGIFVGFDLAARAFQRQNSLFASRLSLTGGTRRAVSQRRLVMPEPEPLRTATGRQAA